MQTSELEKKLNQLLGDEECINFRPSPNFKHMKKYLKSKFEEANSSPNHSSDPSTTPNSEEQETVKPQATSSSMAQRVQPPLPPNSPPPDFLVVPKQEVEDDEYNDKTSTPTQNKTEKEVVADKQPEKIMCRKFARGMCTHGATCIYTHELILSQLQGVYTFCKNFQNTVCNFPKCKFVHATVFEKEHFYRTGLLPPHTLAHLKDSNSALGPPTASEATPTEGTPVFSNLPPPLQPGHEVSEPPNRTTNKARICHGSGNMHRYLSGDNEERILTNADDLKWKEGSLCDAPDPDPDSVPVPSKKNERKQKFMQWNRPLWMHKKPPGLPEPTQLPSQQTALVANPPCPDSPASTPTAPNGWPPYPYLPPSRPFEYFPYPDPPVSEQTTLVRRSPYLALSSSRQTAPVRWLPYPYPPPSRPFGYFPYPDLPASEQTNPVGCPPYPYLPPSSPFGYFPYPDVPASEQTNPVGGPPYPYLPPFRYFPNPNPPASMKTSSIGCPPFPGIPSSKQTAPFEASVRSVRSSDPPAPIQTAPVRCPPNPDSRVSKQTAADPIRSPSSSDPASRQTASNRYSPYPASRKV